MRQQLSAARASRVVFSLPEVNIAAGGECLGAERLIQAVGPGVGVHAHAAEVGVEGAAHLRLNAAIKRLPAAAAALNGALHVGHHVTVAFRAPGQG